MGRAAGARTAGPEAAREGPARDLRVGIRDRASRFAGLRDPQRPGVESSPRTSRIAPPPKRREVKSVQQTARRARRSPRRTQQRTSAGSPERHALRSEVPAPGVPSLARVSPGRRRISPRPRASEPPSSGEAKRVELQGEGNHPLGEGGRPPDLPSFLWGAMKGCRCEASHSKDATSK